MGYWIHDLMGEKMYQSKAGGNSYSADKWLVETAMDKARQAEREKINNEILDLKGAYESESEYRADAEAEISRLKEGIEKASRELELAGCGFGDRLDIRLSNELKKLLEGGE